MKDYYAILGVNKQATDSEIKRAYRKLAGQHHPDRGGDSSKFKEVQEAYDVLSDAGKRAQYDQPQGFFTNRHNFDDLVDRYFTEFNVRDQMRNTRVSIWIAFELAVIGGKQLISFNTPGGPRPIEITIPSGIHDDESVRYPGLGPGGTDIVINFRIHGHPVWQRDGLDLLREIELDFWQLILGTEVSFYSIGNRELRLKIPPKTNPGAMLRLRGQGVARQGHNTGDVFIKVKAVMPKNIPNELIEALSKHTATK